jgi:hypothetical protein
VRIKIAFHPVEEKFEVQNPAILSDRNWLSDISEVMNGSVLKIVREYAKFHPEINEEIIAKSITNLLNIPKKQIGLIELSSDLDIDTVTEIFIRINSKGAVLSQADFAMSKIASNTDYNGDELRKAIDYFCHLSVAPEFYRHIAENDTNFAQTDLFRRMEWLKTENDDLYDPNYSDLIRVAFTSQFNRGRLSDLVSLLSGRNFEMRTFEEAIAEQSFATLREGVGKFISETNFKRFLMILKSAGFIAQKLIHSRNALNFAYIVYLKLKELNYPEACIGSHVCRWFVYSILTHRYSGSPESAFEQDVRQLSERPFDEVLREREEAELSEAFWNVSLPQRLSISLINASHFLIFLVAQVKANDKGFLSKDILVRDLITQRGDVHHLFPRDYLKKNGLERGTYNQVANYAYMQSEINIKIGNRPPKEYFGLIQNHIQNAHPQISGISTAAELLDNLRMHCIPPEIMDMELSHYPDFLAMRRKLMAAKIRNYYKNL